MSAIAWILSHDPARESELLLLAASLRVFVVGDMEIVLAHNREPRTNFLEALKSLGAIAMTASTSCADRPLWLRVEPTPEKRIALDADTLCLSRFEVPKRFSLPINLKPIDQWNTGLPPVTDVDSFPKRRVFATTSREWIPALFEPAFIAFGKDAGLGPRWSEAAARCAVIKDEEARRQLTLAHAVDGLSCDALDERFSFPAHLKPLPICLPYFCRYQSPEILRQEPGLVSLVRELLEQSPVVGAFIREQPGWDWVERPSRFRGAAIGSSIRRDLIITGIPRSGTSYLCNLLHRFEECVILNEPDEIFAPLAAEHLPWGVPRFYRTIRAAILEGHPIRNKLKDGEVTEDTMLIQDWASYKPAVSRPDFILGTKNPRMYLQRLRSLQQVMPAARIAVCVRNPFDTIASWKKYFAQQGQAPPAPPPPGHPRAHQPVFDFLATVSPGIERHAMRWRLLAELVLDELPRIALVRYTDLVLNPMSVINPLLDGYAPGTLKRPIEPSSIRARPGELTAEECGIVRTVCGDAAGELGLIE